MARSLFSYVVRFDSGFAPNPFHGYCTLATCKVPIRRDAQVNDWVVGTASGARAVRRDGHLVYAMRVTEILSTMEYWHDPRFRAKRPDLYYNWMAASGDNIYEPIGPSEWRQLDSYHSSKDGQPNDDHTRRDTGVQRVLVSQDYVYCGGEGPGLPCEFTVGETNLCVGRGYRRCQDADTITRFEGWIRSLA